MKITKKDKMKQKERMEEICIIICLKKTNKD